MEANIADILSRFLLHPFLPASHDESNKASQGLERFLCRVQAVRNELKGKGEAVDLEAPRVRKRAGATAPVWNLTILFLQISIWGHMRHIGHMGHMGHRGWGTKGPNHQTRSLANWPPPFGPFGSCCYNESHGNLNNPNYFNVHSSSITGFRRSFRSWEIVFFFPSLFLNIFLVVVWQISIISLTWLGWAPIGTHKPTCFTLHRFWVEQRFDSEKQFKITMPDVPNWGYTSAVSVRCCAWPITSKNIVDFVPQNIFSLSFFGCDNWTHCFVIFMSVAKIHQKNDSWYACSQLGWAVQIVSNAVSEYCRKNCWNMLAGNARANLWFLNMFANSNGCVKSNERMSNCISQ